MSEADVMTVRANGNGGFDLVPCTEPEDRPRLVHEQDYAKLEAEHDRLADALDETLDRIRTFRIWFEDDYTGFADLPDDDPLLEETARLGLIGRAEEILEAYRRER